MKEVSDVTAIVIDHGLFIGVAQRLAREFKRVLYCCPTEQGFPTLNQNIVGDGFDDIEHVSDYWSVKDEVDLWVFPDIGWSGLQLELEAQGRPVWGSRRADTLELNREKFHRILGDLGLDVPQYEVVVGLTELRRHLRDKEDKFLKISKFRGSMETRHWRSWSQDESFLDILATRFGAAKELIRFLVFDNIDTPLEIGSDTYTVDGQWPSLMLHGIEKKDSSYLSAVTRFEDMPEQCLEILNAFTPILKKHRMRNQWSTEIRVLDEKAYFTDPTPRGGLPSTASQLEAWSNFPEIVWAGAHGEMVNPIKACEFTAEVIVSVKTEDHQWGLAELPDELRQWFKPSNACMIDGRYCFPEDVAFPDAAGWLVAIADTPKAVLQKLKDYIELLPDGVSADITSLAGAIENVEDEADAGIHFTDKPMPDSAAVLS